jgi:hypothetical protein
MSKRNGQHDEPVAPARLNPIIAAMMRYKRGRPPTIILDGWESVPRVQLQAIVPFNFNDETIREVGSIVLLSLLTGDRRIVKTVKDAIKEADHIFNRDREPVLVKHVLKYLPSLMRSGLDIVTLKKEIEKRSNQGRPLQQHQWNRIRKALRLPPLPTGAPRKSDTKRHQSVS